MKKIVIVGSSGFAREIEWIINRINSIIPTWNFVGYIDCQNKKDVIGDDSYLLNYAEELAVVIAIGDPSTRQRLVEMYKKNEKLFFPNIIDPSVICSNSVVLGQGNIICANTVLTVDIRVGNFNIINLGCTIGHETIIKDYVTLSPSVNVSGNVILENRISIGTGCQIIPQKHIDHDVVLGAGAVVVRDIQSDCTALGVPARIVK
ncbi:MAG: NeuD/PglB/VioB family sugar acetyltransferase [Lachnospiraceae bacterium]|nr:NeuD/PglB/VioB family sugar acetyltransferase [Lachnospiraceae bacterium]